MANTIGTDSSKIISQLLSGFSGFNDMPIIGTRYIGGHNRKITPLINGYFQFIVNLPSLIFNQTAPPPTDGSTPPTQGSADTKTYPISNNWLTASCESWTPPTRTITSGDVPGQGGLGASFITGQTLNRTFTTTHRDYNNLPINKIFRIWSNVINTYTGVSELGGANWDIAGYKTDGYVVKTKPTAQADGGLVLADIEEIWYFTGMFPEGDGEDGLGDDINSPDMAGTYSITWHFDGYPYRDKNKLFDSMSSKFADGKELYKNTPKKMFETLTA